MSSSRRFSTRSSVTVISALLSLATAAALAPPTPAQSRKLNPPLAREILGDVLDFRVTSDGARAVYLAGERLGPPELFSVPTKGRTEVIGLTGPVVPPIAEFELTSGGRTLVYRAGDLFSVPVDGSSAPLRLHEPVLPPGFVVSFQLSPDGGRVVYAVRLPTGGYEFRSVPADGSAEPVPLGPVVSSIGAHRISPDGGTVVYITRPQDRFELWSAPIDGASTPTLLNGPNPAASGLVFRISPDSRRVAYWADPHRNLFELFSAPIDGSAQSVQLSGPLVAHGDVQQDFAIAADGRRVVYRADRDQDGVFELYSAPIARRAPPVELNGALVAGGDVQSFQVTPDGKQVVYLADQEEDGRSWLYRTRIDGSSSPVRVGGGPPPIEVLDYQLSSQSDRVVYRGRSTQFTADLYSASLATSVEALPLSSGFVREFEISPDGRAVVLVRGGGFPYELVVVPSDGSGALVPLSHTTRVSDFEIASDGESVLFLAEADAYDVNELFSVPSDASREPAKLSGALLAGDVVGHIDSFQFDPAGKRLVFGAQGHTDESPIVSDEAFVVSFDRVPEPLQLFPWTPHEPNDFFGSRISADGAHLVFSAGNDPSETSGLYSIPLEGARPAALLSDPPLTYYNNVGQFEVTPDSRTVLYIQRDDEKSELYSVAIDRSSDPVELNGPLVEGGGVSSFVLTPDGSRLVYAADQRIDGTYELFALSLPPSGDPEPLLDDPPAHAVGAGLLQTSANGERVAFLSDLVTDGVYELFSIRIDGSDDPVKLNATPVAGGDVLRYVITPDSRRVVYLADLEIDEARELFSAPLDGSAPAVKLGGPIADWLFEVSPNGSRAVYVSDQETAGVFELWSVPADGSAPSVKLNRSLVAGGSLRDLFGRVAFRISPPGTHVVYQADQDTDEVIELYSVPIDGGAPALKLSGALVAGGDVWTVYGPALRISPDGRWVAFQADRDADDVFELFLVPIDGSIGPQKLNGPLVPGGDVGLGSIGTRFEFSPDSRRVVYVADQDTDEERELYESPLPAPEKRRAPPSALVR